MARRNTPTGRVAGAAAGQATRRRKAFEAGDPARMSTISDVQFSESRTMGEAGISPHTAYSLMDLHRQEPTSPHPLGQQELPGMTSRRTGIESGLISRHNATALPDLAPAPQRWEEMHPHEQQHTLAMARQYGVTPESMHRSFSAQLDQGHLRAREHGMTPYASHFYSGDDPSRPSTPTDMQPREVLKQSATANEVPFSTQVLGNAKTSPKTKFRQVSAAGEVRYPNDEAATVAIQSAKAGIPHEQVTKPPGLQALEGNVKRASYMTSAHLAGTPMDEIRNPPSKTSPQGGEAFGPKTGPYANSFIDPHGSSQFFVSDVHSGGAGMAPHIPHEAPFKRDESGEIALTAANRPKRGKSQREDYLGIPGIHALHDHVARQVMHERGLHSLSGAQATQWGEEQVSRGEIDRGARQVTLVSMEDAYKKPHTEVGQVHGQLDIHGVEHQPQTTATHIRPSNAASLEAPEGRERERAEWAIAARQRNMGRTPERRSRRLNDAVEAGERMSREDPHNPWAPDRDAYGNRRGHG
jgi:hypothetical protein